jgi:uncharacterized damage-inducible protein DinB
MASFADSKVEPWLRGALDGVPRPVMPLFFSFAQVREDLQHHVADLTAKQLWEAIGTNASVGFHMRHLGGSIDRLLTYLEGGQLSHEQLASAKEETSGAEGFSQVYEELDRKLRDAEDRLRRMDLADLYAPRYVGRKRLESTVLGLLVHIAEHTQRHLGQAITTAKLVRDTAGQPNQPAQR